MNDFANVNIYRMEYNNRTFVLPTIHMTFAIIKCKKATTK